MKTNYVIKANERQFGAGKRCDGELLLCGDTQREIRSTDAMLSSQTKKNLKPNLTFSGEPQSVIGDGS